jgi:hypothetical protein
MLGSLKKKLRLAFDSVSSETRLLKTLIVRKIRCYENTSQQLNIIAQYMYCRKRDGK